MLGINNLKGKKLFESCYATKDIGVVNVAPGSPLKLREYQEEAVDIAINNQCSGINIPTGAGKTHIALSSFLLKKKQNNNLGLIVAVPQNDIGENFTKRYYYPLKGENYEINKAFFSMILLNKYVDEQMSHLFF